MDDDGRDENGIVRVDVEWLKGDWINKYTNEEWRRSGRRDLIICYGPIHAVLTHDGRSDRAGVV